MQKNANSLGWNLNLLADSIFHTDNHYANTHTHTHTHKHTHTHTHIYEIVKNEQIIKSNYVKNKTYRHKNYNQKFILIIE